MKKSRARTLFLCCIALEVVCDLCWKCREGRGGWKGGVDGWSVETWRRKGRRVMYFISCLIPSLSYFGVMIRMRKKEKQVMDKKTGREEKTKKKIKNN